jgi:regulator of protease activity HflC (stomatin/prohibitin superfamily)
MRKVLSMLSICILGIFGLTGCYKVVEPGHVGIKVNMTGSDRGVSNYTTTTGRVFYNPVNSQVFQYPTYNQNAVWTANTAEGHPTDESITFTTKDSLAVNADFNVSYQLDGDKVPLFYVKFRNDDIQGFTDGYMHNIARDCINRVAGNYNVEEIMGDNAPFLDSAKACVQADLSKVGVVLNSFGLIGAPRPPQSVIQAINLKVQAQQIALQKQTEVTQAQADAAKQVAEAEGNSKAHIAQAQGDAAYKIKLAEAEAEANRALSQSLTPSLLEWRKLQIQDQAVAKWDGQRPQVEGSGSGLLLQITPREKNPQQ